MLFATLDPTMRGVRLASGPEVILSDTVGFISDLPTELVAAFRATLEEVTAADLIVHVRDISHPNTEEQAADVQAIIASLGVLETTPQIEVWNKIDLLDPEAREGFAARASREEDIFALSAWTGEGMEALLEAIAHRLEGETREDHLRLGFDEGRKRAWLFDRGLVEDERQDEDGYALTVRWSAKDAAQFEKL